MDLAQIDPSMIPPGMSPDELADALANYYYSCHEVSPTCPVEATTLGYYPNRGINIFFVIAYGLAMVVTLAIGLRKKTWSYTSFIAAGCALELAGGLFSSTWPSWNAVGSHRHMGGMPNRLLRWIESGLGVLRETGKETKKRKKRDPSANTHHTTPAGYGARISLTDNPWNKHAFETQIVAIILAPTLICISVYLTLKHVCLALRPALSRVRPHLYPFVFVPLDVSCLLVQAIGGALAASGAGSAANLAMVQHGNRCIIAGIVLQVVVLLFFGASAGDYYLRVKKWCVFVLVSLTLTRKMVRRERFRVGKLT